MKPEIKEHFVAALRSGKYEQGTHRLRVEDRFCCLGVLCDLHGTEQWENQVADYTYLNESEEPPQEVMEWAGLLSEDVATLINLNDVQQKSFREIAEYVERVL